MRAALARRRVSGGGGGGGGGGTDFTSLTNWSRPTSLATTPTANRKPFTTSAGLTSALNGMVAGDYIYYAGTSGSPLVISSSSSVPFPMTGHNPSANVTIDFGTVSTTQIDAWSPGASSASAGNYVKFAYTGTSNITNAMTLMNCSNLTIYGGYFTTQTSTTVGGVGCINEAPLSNINWYDAYVSNVGLSGFAFRGQNSSGAASVITNCLYRVEVNRWSMRPDADTHPDKGTGNHACIVHGTTGQINDTTFAIYGHDPLLPGEIVNINGVNVTYPEGGGGCVIEPGNDTGGPLNNYTIYAKGTNLLMKPTGAGGNPGSSGSGQTAGNIVNLWGSIPLDGCVVNWAEGSNCTGAVVHGTVTGGYYPGSPPITVNHGRGVSMNQFTGGGNTTEKYVGIGAGTGSGGTATSDKGIVFHDCT